MVKEQKEGYSELDENDKSVHTSKSELGDIKEEPENFSTESENKNTNEQKINNVKKNENVSKPRVVLIDNIKATKGIPMYRKEDKSTLKKHNESKCLKGILKSRNNNNFPQQINTQKTEETISNPCPRYFGIKSYIDCFYYPPDSSILNSGEFIQDDFEFVVEPGKRRWRNCWFKVGLWGGINLLLLGIIALLVGHLTPPRDTIVARIDNLEVVDRSALTFNSRLQLCRLSGITIFCIGGIVLMLTLLISSYQQDTSSYYVMNTAFMPELFSRMQGTNQKVMTSRIPLSGTLKQVQPR